MKKFLFVLALLFLVIFVLAVPPELDPQTNNFFDAVGKASWNGIKWLFSSILGFIINGAKFLVGDGMLMVRVFFFIFLLFVVHTAIDMSGIVSRNKIVVMGVSFAVVVITMVALPDKFLALVFPIYDSLLSTFAVFIVFMILMFATIKTEIPILARLIWIVSAIIFSLLFFTKGIEFFTSQGATWGVIILSLAIVSIVMAIFTPTIREWFIDAEMLELEQSAEQAAEIDAAVTKKHIAEAKASRKKD